jgi:hypothetical protein
MSNDDELDRLIREVDASLAGGSAPTGGQVAKVPASGRAAARKGGSAAERGRVGGALRTGTIAGAVCGTGVMVVTFLFSWLPFDQSPLNAGGGAFVGAFLTGAVLTVTGRSSGPSA